MNSPNLKKFYQNSPKPVNYLPNFLVDGSPQYAPTMSGLMLINPTTKDIWVSAGKELVSDWINIVGGGGGGGTYTVNNGLTENPANNFQLGGNLLQFTNIYNKGNSLNVIREQNATYSLSGAAIVLSNVNSIGNANGIPFSQALYAEGFNALGALVFGGGDMVDNHSVQPILKIERGTALLPDPDNNEIGGSIDFVNPYVQVGSLIGPQPKFTNSLISIWEQSIYEAAPFGGGTYPASRFEIWGYGPRGAGAGSTLRNAAFRSNGEVIFDGYGAAGFVTTTPEYLLGVTNTGNIVEVPAPLSSTVTLNENVTMSISTWQPIFPSIPGFSVPLKDGRSYTFKAVIMYGFDTGGAGSIGGLFSAYIDTTVFANSSWYYQAWDSSQTLFQEPRLNQSNDTFSGGPLTSRYDDGNIAIVEGILSNATGNGSLLIQANINTLGVLPQNMYIYKGSSITISETPY
jgi:hypothetical protein